ncbi:hypothetical protein EMMF5_004339, partial [Cystobasidiomycetes sp. EMM_F5]
MVSTGPAFLQETRNGIGTHEQSGRDAYLAKPSGTCCLKGSIHSGDPKGRWETIAGVETYISPPTSENANGHILLYFADVWGMFLNGLLVMDAFAEAGPFIDASKEPGGYLVLGLDYFCGDPVWKHRKDRHDATTDPGFDYEAWKRKHIAFADAHVPPWVEAVSKQYGQSDTKYAAVGYCFGAPYVCNELAGMVVSAGAFAHPAFLKEAHFKKLKKPLFLSCSEVDHTFDTASRRRAIDILQEDGKSYQLQLFAGVEHGFALRGNQDNPYEHVNELSNWNPPPISPEPNDADLLSLMNSIFGHDQFTYGHVVPLAPQTYSQVADPAYASTSDLNTLPFSPFANTSANAFFGLDPVDTSSAGFSADIALDSPDNAAGSRQTIDANDSGVSREFELLRAAKAKVETDQHGAAAAKKVNLGNAIQ